MPDTDMSLDDLANDKSVVDAQVRFQTNSTGPIRTSQSQSDEPVNTLVTYDLSGVMQGMALYKPAGVGYDAFNQELSKELQGLGVEEKWKKRDDKLTPYDVFIKDPVAGTGASVTEPVGVVGQPSGGGGQSAAPLTGGTSDCFVVGDSITEGCKSFLEAGINGWKFTVDALRSRPPQAGLEVLRARNGDFGTAVVVNLGTNPGPDPATFIGETMQLLANVPRVCWVTCNEWADYPAAINVEIHSLQGRNNKVVVVDWASYVKTNRSILAIDGIHCTSEGYQTLSNMIATALGPAPGAP